MRWTLINMQEGRKWFSCDIPWYLTIFLPASFLSVAELPVFVVLNTPSGNKFHKESSNSFF